MSTAPRNACLVAHTHWDREWYLPFSRFRVNLVGVVDDILDALDNDPDVPHFLLDGQTAVLEDYLTAKPEARDRINRLVREGRLAVGPWYILPDEFLVSGEATARNLLYGRQTTPLGKHHAVGYMPDSFGHVAQMPQILQMAGLDNFVFTRGMDNQADETGWLFRWQGPDGTEVLAVNQGGGYDNAAGLGLQEMWHGHTQRTVDPAHAVTQIKALFEKMSARPGGEPALINNGGDHLGPQRDTGAVLAALRKAFPDTTFTPTTLAGFLKAARAETADAERPVVTGELLGGRDHLILSGIWSARMPLKQQNEACQSLLCRVVEPLHAAAWAWNGQRWPGGLLDVAWRELLRNHPHDSIGGCSTDSVAADMETRFAAVRQTGEQMTSRLMNYWTPAFASEAEGDHYTVISVANPLPQRRSEVVERLVILPPGDIDPYKLHLLNLAGDTVPYEIVKRRYIERFWGIDYRAELYAADQFDLLDTYLHRFGDRIIGTEADRYTHDTFLHVRFLAEDLPAVGHATYRLTNTNGPAATMPPPVVVTRSEGQAHLANEHLQVILHGDGTIDLTDRATGHQYLGLNLLEDAEDIGDEYDYCPCDPNQMIFSGGCDGKIRLADSSDLRGVAATTFRFDLPRSLDQGRRKRHPRTTPCDVTVEVVLNAGARRLEISTTFNNRAFDHRLRTWFPTGLVTDEVVSDGHFMLNRRPITRPTDAAWPQPAPPTWPQQDFAFLSDGTHGLAIFNRGLPEFETIGSGDGSVIYALTLLRSVDWLSRDDFPSRKNTNAGPTLHTPEAQCIGRQTFQYAVMPCGPDVFAADVKGESEAYRVVPPVVQGVGDGATPGGHSLVYGTDPRVAITAIKKAAKGDVLMVRLYNQGDTELTETLHFGLPVLDADKVSLVESELHIFRDDPAIIHGGRQVSVPLAPYEIATLALSLEWALELEST